MWLAHLLNLSALYSGGTERASGFGITEFIKWGVYFEWEGLSAS